VPAGESRALPVLIDLTQTPPGRYTADVDVECENCRFLLIRTCQFDRQRLTIAVDAVAPPPIAAPAAPAVTRATQPPPSRIPAQTAAPGPRQATPPPVNTQAPPAIETTQTPVLTEAAPAPRTATCSDQLTMAGAIAAAAVIAALACAGWAMNSARAAREAMQQAGDGRGGRLRETLQQRLEECEALANSARAELETLLHAQFHAMRAAAALGVGDAARLADQTQTWTGICSDAGYGVDAKTLAIEPRRSQRSLQDAMATVARADGFPPFGADPDAASHQQRLSWLRGRGFAADDEGAQAVLCEMADYLAYGRSMRGMNERLRECLIEVRRAEAELASLATQAGGT
jgi:hypothetical protein